MRQNEWYLLDLGNAPSEIEETNPELAERVQQDDRLLDNSDFIIIHRDNIETVLKDYDLDDSNIEDIVSYFMNRHVDEEFEYFINNNTKYYGIIKQDDNAIMEIATNEFNKVTKETIKKRMVTYLNIFLIDSYMTTSNYN